MRVLALIVGVLLVGGCSAPGPDGPATSTGTTTSSTPAPAETPDPWSITIPKIGAHSTLVPLGLNEKAELEVPPVDQPMQAGWYAGADPAFDGDEHKPGDVGPAVIAGHVDGVVDGRKGQPGVFHRLHELAPGDEVIVDRADASRIRFVVTGVQRFAKDAFPWDRVMGPTGTPELRLITCGGEFDRQGGHYVDNVVVFAELAD